MPGNARRTKRVHIDQGTVVPLALVAGIVAAVSAASPTGSASIDPVIVGVGVAAFTWICAAASWWVLIVSSGVALATSMRLDLIIVATVALGIALRIGMHQRNHSVLRAVVGALAFNVLVRSELGGFAGLSTIVGLSVAALVYGSGTRRRTSEQSVWIHGVALGFLASALAASGLLAASALNARSNLENAIDSLRDGMNQLSAGDQDTAANTFAESARQLDLARDRVNAFWTQPARIVPVVAQHRRAIDDLSSDASDLVRIITEELDRLDLDSLRPVDGIFDLQAVDRAAASTSRLRMAIMSIEDTVADTKSMWLLRPIQREIEDLNREISKQRNRFEDVDAAMTELPGLLGSDEVRRYFIAFTTPAEARGIGGFMGSWAELTADRGRLTLSRQGRTGDLNAADATERTVSGPEDFLATWGRYGFASDDGATESDVWSNVTVSAHFPSTGRIIAELYPQSGGQNVDGVFALDVEALATFLEFTGPVKVEGVTRPIGPDNANQFLLFDQYRLGDGRAGVLDAVSRAVMESLLGGALPGPRQLVETLAPAVRESRIVGYAVRPDEQDLFERLGMAGALPVPVADDAIVVAFNNASASKLELFLDASMDYTMDVDERGALTSTLELTLTNSAPTSGWPEGVIGNYVDLPTGTNQLMVTVYSRFAPTSVTFTGDEPDTDVGREAGYVVSRWFVILDPDSTETLTLTFAGNLDPSTFDEDRIPVIVRTPAMVRDFPVRVVYSGPDGQQLIASIDRPGIVIRPLGSEDLAGE